MPLTNWVVLFMGSLAGALGGALETFLPDACFDLGLVAWEVRESPLSSIQAFCGLIDDTGPQLMGHLIQV